MTRQKAFYGIVFLISQIACPCWAQTPFLSIDVGLKDTTVELFAGKPAPQGEIAVTGKIQNITQKDLYLSEYNCSYLEDWKTDNKAVVPDAPECDKNFPRSFILKPGEIHEESVPLLITGDVLMHDIHFRLGYEAHKPTSDRFERAPLNGAPLWSKQIVLHVKSASERKQKYCEGKIPTGLCRR